MEVVVPFSLLWAYRPRAFYGACVQNIYENNASQINQTSRIAYILVIKHEYLVNNYQ